MNGLYADPYFTFKWVAETEDEANQFVEKVVNLLAMVPYGDSWYADREVDDEQDELILDMEPVDTVQSSADNLKEVLEDYIVNPEYV